MYGARLLGQIGMPSHIPQRQVILAFSSLIKIAQFKHECACPDFYIDRDKLMLVGSFRPDQVKIAVEKYKAEVLKSSF